MIVLKAYNPFPPGGFVYEQPYPGGIQPFNNTGLSIEQQAAEVLAFRKGNNLPGANIKQVIQDISVYTCIRLGGMPDWCIDTDNPIQVYTGAYGAGSGGCSTCGKSIS